MTEEELREFLTILTSRVEVEDMKGQLEFRVPPTGSGFNQIGLMINMSDFKCVDYVFQLHGIRLKVLCIDWIEITPHDFFVKCIWCCSPGKEVAAPPYFGTLNGCCEIGKVLEAATRILRGPEGKYCADGRRYVLIGLSYVYRYYTRPTGSDIDCSSFKIGSRLLEEIAMLIQEVKSSSKKNDYVCEDCTKFCGVDSTICMNCRERTRSWAREYYKEDDNEYALFCNACDSVRQRSWQVQVNQIY